MSIIMYLRSFAGALRIGGDWRQKESLALKTNGQTNRDVLGKDKKIIGASCNCYFVMNIIVC